MYYYSKREVYTHDMSLPTLTLVHIHWHDSVYNTYTTTHWDFVMLLSDFMGNLCFMESSVIIPCVLIRSLLFHTGSVTGLLGDTASSFFIPPPESRHRDPLDRALALGQTPAHSGWTQAPTEVPLYVPHIAPSRQEPSGPLPSPPK